MTGPLGTPLHDPSPVVSETAPPVTVDRSPPHAVRASVRSVHRARDSEVTVGLLGPRSAGERRGWAIKHTTGGQSCRRDITAFPWRGRRGLSGVRRSGSTQSGDPGNPPGFGLGGPPDVTERLERFDSGSPPTRLADASPRQWVVGVRCGAARRSSSRLFTITAAGFERVSGPSPRLADDRTESSNRGDCPPDHWLYIRESATVDDRSCSRFHRPQTASHDRSASSRTDSRSTPPHVVGPLSPGTPPSSTIGPGHVLEPYPTGAHPSTAPATTQFGSPLRRIVVPIGGPLSSALTTSRTMVTPGRLADARPGFKSCRRLPRLAALGEKSQGPALNGSYKSGSRPHPKTITGAHVV